MCWKSNSSLHRFSCGMTMLNMQTGVKHLDKVPKGIAFSLRGHLSHDTLVILIESNDSWLLMSSYIDEITRDLRTYNILHLSQVLQTW